MKFSEYLLNRDEQMAFYVLEQEIQNEYLLKGLQGIWNIATGKKYNQGDAKSAMNASNLIANVPDVVGAGKGVFDVVRRLALSGAVLGGGGEYKVPEPVPVVRNYVPHPHQNDDDINSHDIYKGAKAARKEAEAEGYAKASSFANMDKRRRRLLGFIDQTPSI